VTDISCDNQTYQNDCDRINEDLTCLFDLSWAFGWAIRETSFAITFKAGHVELVEAWNVRIDPEEGEISLPICNHIQPRNDHTHTWRWR
jgi:hypothetical protein